MKHQLKFLFIVLVSFNSCYFAIAQLNSHKLGEMYNQSACGLNYAVDSWLVTQRIPSNPGLGLPAKLKFTKLPNLPCYKIDTAFLWWTVSYRNLECFYRRDSALKYCTNVFQEFDDYFNVTYCGTPKLTQSTITVTNPNNITETYTSTMVGEDGSKKWYESGTRTYRADVTKSITGNGNYSVNIGGSPGDIERIYETDGFMLMVVYRDPLSTYQGTLIINDGCYTRSDANVTCGLPSTDSITGFSACGNSISANAFLLVSDLQSNAQKTFQATLNGKTTTDSSKFFNFTSTSTSVIKGQNVSQFGVAPDPVKQDCYTLAVTGLYYQTTSCVTCVPSDTSSSLTLVKSSTPAMCGANTGTATVSPLGGTRPYKYAWSPGGATDSIAKNLAPGTYTVAVSDDACKSKVDSVIVTAAGGFSLPHPSQINATCYGGSDGSATVAPTGGAKPYTYSWTTNPVQTNATATGLKIGKYIITVQDQDGCQLKDSVTITQPNDLVFTSSADSSYCGQANGTATINVVSGGTTPYSYSWTTSPVQTTAKATGLKSGTYTVRVKYPASAVCYKDTTVTVPSAGGFTATYSKKDILCYGDSTGRATVIASGGKRPYTYTWSPSGGTDSVAVNLKAGTYSVVTKDANKCEFTIPSITIDQPTSLNIITTDTSICIGKSATIHAEATGGVPSYNYLWNNSITTTSQTVTPDTTTSYTITVTDTNKCKKNATVTVTVTPPPVANVSSSGAVDLCTADSATLTISAPGATSYMWSTGATTSSINVRPATITTYTVSAATNNCQSIEQTYVVTVTKSQVVSSFTPDPVKGTAPLSVNFTNNSSNGISYTWIFGDGSTPSNMSTPPAHLYDPAGIYTVQLIAMNGICGDTISKTIEVVPISSLSIPNVFTPNGDNVNDIFKVKAYAMREFNAVIYNRWGKKMYEWNNPDEGWDGLKCEDGTYYYVIKAVGLDDAVYNETGYVLMISKR